jgi:hypothetical protein
MSTVQMWPPANGNLNTIYFNSRSYSSTPGNPVSVQSFDVPVLQANGWTTYATTAGQTTIPLVLSSSKPASPILIYGRSYTGSVSTPINVPLFDAPVLEANGFIQSFASGGTSSQSNAIVAMGF